MSIIKSIKINPNILLIIDDCGEYLKDKVIAASLKTLFFRGRHLFCTIIISA